MRSTNKAPAKKQTARKAPQKPADPTRLPDPKDVTKSAEKAQNAALKALQAEQEQLVDKMSSDRQETEEFVFANKGRQVDPPRAVDYRVSFISSRKDSFIHGVVAVQSVAGMVAFYTDGNGLLPERMLNTSQIKDINRLDSEEDA